MLAGGYLVQSGAVIPGIALIVVALLYWIVIAVVNSAASQVLVAALYRFATTGDTGGGIPNQAARAVFNPNTDWSHFQDPKTGRIAGA